MAKTLTQLLAATRRFVDEIDTTEGWADAELIDYINDGQRFLTSEIFEVNPEYLLTRSTTPTVAGQQAYTVPLNLFGNEMRGLWVYSASDGTRTLIDKASPEEVMQDTSESGCPKIFAQVRGNFILAPIPDAVYTLELWYIAGPTDLASGSDTTAFKDEDTEIICMWAAVKAKMRKGLDVSDLNDLLKVKLDQLYNDILGDGLRTSKPKEIY